MPPVRWLLVFTILVVKDVKGASVAEEINFEVSNMRDSAKTDSQVQELDKTEDDQEDSGSRNESDEPEIAPSEIVETHVLPEESPQEEVNMQMKRPRRRRRRRRRKRPKPTAVPEDAGAFYPAPEEETKRKPMKYKQPETNEEIPQETSTQPRRRNVKRRRRPQKRPIPEDIIPTAEEISEQQTNSTADELQDHTNHPYPQEETRDKFNPQDSPERLIPYSPKTQKPEPEHPADHFTPITNRPILSEIETTKTLKDEVAIPDYGLNHDQRVVPESNNKVFTTKENRFPKTLMSDERAKLFSNDDHFSRAPNTAFVFSKLATQEEDETTIIPKRRKRPTAKGKNATEIDNDKHEGELWNGDTRSQNNNLRKSDDKFNFTASVSPKSENSFKIRESGKKEGFKIRRLPPTSAILRQVKIRPLKKNETQNRIEEHFNNEIILFNETTTSRSESRDPSRSSHYLPANVSDEEDNFHPPLVEKVPEEDEENFESLIIKHSTQPVPKSTSLPSPSPSTTSSTTENTAFIYIPCNHTLNEVVLKHKSNFTGDHETLPVTNRSHKYSNSSPKRDPVTPPQKNPVEQETTDVLKSVAIEELEELFQQTLSTTSSTTSTPKYTSISRNNTQHYYDESKEHSIESGLSENYRFRNNSPPKTRIFQPTTDLPENHNREPKWYQDYAKPQRDSKERKYDDSFSKSSAPNKELVLLYTSTPNPGLVYNDVDSDEFSLHIRNNTFPRKYYQESLVHRAKTHAERKKLPLAVKSAIIISGAILALAVLGFFALLLSCKIRQAKSRMKCHRELYRENFHNSEFRQSSRSTSPVVSKTNYSGRSFANNMQPTLASNRNYYLWQTLRKTFQYD